MSTHNLKPLSEVIKDLRGEGFDKEFRFTENHLQTYDDQKQYESEDLKIVEEYRFEGDSDPGMMTILYALEANDGIKGTITNAYGANANLELGEFMKKVKETS